MSQWRPPDTERGPVPRAHARARVAEALEIDVDGAVHTVTSRDVSFGGVGCDGLRALISPGTEVKIRVPSLADAWLPARVVWRQEGGATGFQFASLRRAERQVVTRLVKAAGG